MARYSVSYCSGATGYGWDAEYDRLDQFEDFINEMRDEITAAVRVWDNRREEFIFWKRALDWKPEIDMLHDVMRDMRTKTGQMK